MANAGVEKANPIARFFGFFRESWIELKKVQSPTREEAKQITLVVLMMIVGCALFLGLVDYVVGQLMSNIIAS